MASPLDWLHALSNVMATAESPDRTCRGEITSDSSPVSPPPYVELTGATQAPNVNPVVETGEEVVGREGHWRGVEMAVRPAMAQALLASSPPRR